MTKTATAATSLVAAVPAGFLAYLGVMAFLQHADAMATMLQVVTGLTLLIAVLMALSPFAVLLFMRGAKAEDEAAAAGAAKPAAAAAVAAPAAAALATSELESELESESAMDVEELPVESEDEFGFDEEPGSEEIPAAELEGSGDSFEFDDDDFQFDDEEFK